MKSWKTTICGLILIAAGIVFITLKETAYAVMSIPAGIGLLAAKDSTVTGVGEDKKSLKEINKENDKVS